MLKKILQRMNWIVFLVLVVYPIVLAALGVNYIINHQFGLSEGLLMVSGYYISNITVGVALHRLYAHNAFKVNKVVEVILVFMSAWPLQGPILTWASDHYRHHTYTDKGMDPHSPLKYKNKIAGFLWSHIGWMLFSEDTKSIDRVTMVKLGKNKLLVWQLKHYWQLAVFMNTVVPALIGFLIGGNLSYAYTAFLFMGIGRALQQQATFCVNSLCHFVGTKQYSKGTAGDIWWMAIFLLGENWHNFHHAFPSDYRNGAKWYHFDVHKWIIYGMSKLGLASDLQRTSDVRVQAKMSETLNYLIEKYQQQAVMLQDKVFSLKNSLYPKLKEFENSSAAITVQVQKSLFDIQESLNKIAKQLSEIQNLPSDKFVEIATTQLKALEESFYNTYNKWQKLSSVATA